MLSVILFAQHNKSGTILPDYSIPFFAFFYKKKALISGLYYKGRNTFRSEVLKIHLYASKRLAKRQIMQEKTGKRDKKIPYIKYGKF